MILEPIVGNAGFIQPEPGFLEGLRELNKENGALLVFDEVMTGFRISYGGAQAHFGVTPDLTTMGKVIGGGLPVGAYGGRREIMEMVAPAGPMYQAGTLSGNPLAMTAGIKTLELLKQPGTYEKLAATTEKLITGIKAAAGDADFHHRWKRQCHVWLLPLRRARAEFRGSESHRCRAFRKIAPVHVGTGGLPGSFSL